MGNLVDKLDLPNHPKFSAETKMLKKDDNDELDLAEFLKGQPSKHFGQLVGCNWCMRLR
jgi:hypothetical protein